jgi:hypothetical protein
LKDDFGRPEATCTCRETGARVTSIVEDRFAVTPVEAARTVALQRTVTYQGESVMVTLMAE